MPSPRGCKQLNERCWYNRVLIMLWKRFSLKRCWYCVRLCSCCGLGNWYCVEDGMRSSISWAHKSCVWFPLGSECWWCCYDKTNIQYLLWVSKGSCVLCLFTLFAYWGWQRPQMHAGCWGCCLLIYPAVWPAHLEWWGRRQEGRLLFHGLLSANAATCPALQF